MTINNCAECGGHKVAIQLIDRGQNNIHYEAVYGPAGGRKKFGKGYEILGSVATEMCEDCGRITLRAIPNS